MSSEFQHTLRGRYMKDTYAGQYSPVVASPVAYLNMRIDVAIGSQISIRHVNTQGGYLHSHPHNYPGGSQRKPVRDYFSKVRTNGYLKNNKSRSILTAILTISGES